MITDVNYTTRAALFKLVTNGRNLINIADLAPIFTLYESLSNFRLSLGVA